MDENGEILREASTPTKLPRSAEAVCDDIAALCLQLAEGEQPAGVGAGVVLDGKLLTGYTGAASEAGHMVIVDAPDAPRCTYGRPGVIGAALLAKGQAEQKG